MAKSSVFRILHTLEASDYIRRNEAGDYSPATEVDHWSSRVFVENLLQVAKPELTRLRSRFGETVSLAVLFDNHIEVVAVDESPHLVRMGNTVGRIIPPHASSVGKAITAYQNDARRETLLRSYGLHRFTEETITDEVELGNEFREIVRRGWSRDHEESTKEGCCLGVPVRIMGEVRAGISISVPISRRPEEKLHRNMIAALQESATEISKHFRLHD
jgi:IclR family acetate operon transcriptional repressor